MLVQRKNKSAQLLSLVLLAISLVVVYMSQLKIIELRRDFHASGDQDTLYLPNSSALKFISFGYNNVVSAAIWINTVSYFGKHYSGDKDYRWLNHYCDLVVSLNPKVYEPYYFCSTMLAWEVAAPDNHRQAVSLLSRAIDAHPKDWFFYYLRGFYNTYFLHDKVAAKDDFIAASHLDGAPAIVARLAANSMSELEDKKSAIVFLNSLLSRTTDPAQIKAFEHKIQELQK